MKDDYGPDSLFKGLGDKSQDGFVNETVETISSVCIEHFVPKDELGLKRKRGRSRKGCSESSATTPTIAEDEPSWERRRGRPRKLCHIAFVPTTSASKG